MDLVEMLKSVKSCFCMHQNQSSFRLFEGNSNFVACEKQDRPVCASAHGDQGPELQYLLKVKQNFS